MLRLLLSVLIFAMTLGNGAAVAAAICEHQDARAHAAALLSPDRNVAAAALSEERAASSADEEGMLADGGASSLLGFVLPPDAELALRTVERAEAPMTATVRLASRSAAPLLEPPLA